MLRVGLVFVALAFGVALVGVVSLSMDGDSALVGEGFDLPRVAHAGGGIGGASYTNSKEAIVASLDRGFEWVEIDFTWTSDGGLVCLHDWESNFSRLFGRSAEEPLSLEAFESERIGKEYTFLTLEDLADMMESDARLKVVTDVKSDNLTALRLISKTLPDASVRVVPQVYLPDEYESVKALGFENIIWTLYRYPKQRDIDRVIAEMTGRNFVAICMSRDRVKDGHALRLKELGVPTFAHTINDPEEWKDLRENWGVTQVYTDFLPASDDS